MARSIDRKAAGEYHHGNLRRALIDGAVVMLADCDPETISLRELTRHIGVDHRAAYRCFADREALLAEVAEEAYRELGADLESALVDPPASAVKRLVIFGRAYIQFATRQPGRYRAMIRPRATEKRDRKRDAADAALDILEREVSRGVARRELVDDDVREMALGLWSTMHGLASLIATRRLFVRKDQILPYTSGILERTLVGLARR